MVTIEKVKITPLHLERNIHVYVPDNLKKNQKCKVIYMFDGHNLFFDEQATYGKSWDLKKYLDESGLAIIVVGIECNHESNYRLWEFSPYDFYDKRYGEVKGQGKELLNWIVNELKPYIDEHYPVYCDAKNTMIAGSSMGGLMSVYAGAKYSHVFSKAACLSPFYPNVFRRLLEDIKSCNATKSSFYISWGAHECSTHRRLAKYSEQNLVIVRELINKNNKVFPHLYENQDHSEGSWCLETEVWMKELGFKK